MLLDEPLSALDLKLRQHMRAELRAIQKRTDVTFIYITHDQGEALAMSDRVGVMSQGKLQQVDVPQAIYNNPVNGFVASFVGENNIFTGSVEAADGNAGVFKTASGVFQAVPGPGVVRGSTARLYVRPEHARLQASPGQGNSLPVTVFTVAFEGNFINVHLTDDHGGPRIVQMRNDSNTPPPAPGARLHLVFDADHAVILLDTAGQRAAAEATGDE
jgi:spermidine/putrescine transport system ATP-binding protein